MSMPSIIHGKRLADETTGQTAPIEGDFFQTENQYSVYVYYRPMGSRYDRLIGVTIIKNEIPML